MKSADTNTNMIVSRENRRTNLLEVATFHEEQKKGINIDILSDILRQDRERETGEIEKERGEKETKKPMQAG